MKKKAHYMPFECGTREMFEEYKQNQNPNKKTEKTPEKFGEDKKEKKNVK